jgi:lipopolysaccharide transport system permease protein
MTRLSKKNTSSGLQEIIIEPPDGKYTVNVSEILAYRELLMQLAWRDLVVRYRQTLLGVTWALINPILMAVIFTVIFGLWARMPTNGVSYPVFFLAGVIPWTFFATAFSSVSESMVRQSALLTKVYFPRLIVPLAATAVALTDYLMAIFVLLVMVFIFGYFPHPLIIIILPLATFWLWLTALASGLWFAAFNVRYRDTGQIVPFAVRIGIFASPVIYPVSIIPDRWHWLYGLNPVVGAIEWIRWGLFRTEAYPSPGYLFSIIFFVPVFILGIRAFRKMEDTYADTV